MKLSRVNGKLSSASPCSFQRLSFFGILDFLHDNGTANSPVCTLPKGFKDRKLANKDLITTYVLGSIGVSAAIIALVVEFVCS